MRVLWFNHRDPLHPEAGGAEVRIHEIGKRLATHGYEIRLVCERWEGAKHHDSLNGIEITRAAGRLGVHLSVPFFLNSVNRYDVVIDDIAHAVPWFSRLFADGPVIGQVHHIHQEVLRMELPPYLAGLTGLTEKAVKHLYEALIAVSESTRRALVDGLGVPSQKVKVILNGVDHGTYHPSGKSPDPLVLCVGRVKRYKRVEHAILAFREVQKVFPNAKLVIVGGGDHLGDLMKFADGLEVSNVEFLGRVGELEKVRLMGQSWLMVGCSSMEGWGMTVIEGAACGTPFVAYNVPGYRDSVRDGETGMLVEDEDVHGLASGMLRILQDKDLRIELSENALAYSRRFNWDIAADEFLKVLDWVCDET
jgi:glycosyltransferase involved in cell wall biosynthesis